MRNKFTEETLIKAITLYNSGLSFREVAQKIGFDAAHIRYHFNKGNIKRRTQKEGAALSEPKKDKSGENNPNWKNGRSNNIQFKLKLTKYAGNKCKDCEIKASESNYSIFEFHHLDPKQKYFAIGESFNLSKSNEEIFLEIDKCDLLCANCHRLRHQKDLGL